ncbi:hypothetical protein Btru_068024 [Bulinus truncatus]|nr:hypothetical protein Btru_068024 [Bulinus truncatus]
MYLKFVIVGDHQYVVGRQSCDIVIPDASVSRKQAILTMAHYESNVAKSFITPTLTLEDVSKFGTYVNGKQVKNPGGNTITLKHNDEIKFGGSPASVFRAIYESFIATTSCLEKAPKKCLHKIMCLLGGHIVRDWRPTCDLLIMSNINVTIKVICAINNQKHIVTPKYLDDLYSYHRNKGEKPDPVNYLPEVVDQEVPNGVSFHPNVKRATLLEGLKFYFLSALQFNKTNLAVSTAGGQPILLEDGTEEDAETMTQDGTVVVAVTRDILVTLSSSCQKFVKLVFSTLKRKNLRMVTDPEIGWSILTCNTEDFCNPRSPITPSMLSSMASQSLSQMTEVDTVRETQSSDIKLAKRLCTADQDNDLKEYSEPQIKRVNTDFSSKAGFTNTLLEKTVVTDKKIEDDVSQKIVNSEKLVKSIVSCRAESTKHLPVVNSFDTIDELKNSMSCSSKFRTLKSPPVSACVENLPQFAGNKHSEPAPLSEAINIFARRNNNKNDRGKKVRRKDSDDESLDCNKRGQKKKPLFLDDDDEELDMAKSRKSSDVDCKNISETGVEKNINNSGKNEENVHDQVDEMAGVFDYPFLEDEIHTPSNYEQVSNTTTSGWTNKMLRCTDVKLGQDVEAKPDTELLFDKEGKLLRNMCDVQVVELVSSHPRKAKVITEPQNGALKNFKKFKKTENVGSKKLPMIIGKRDLEVYLGNNHKDIEDIFTNGLANEKKRQDEEKRNSEFFKDKVNIYLKLIFIF